MKIKKLILSLLVSLATFALVACGGESAKDVVTKYCEALKTLNVEEMNGLMSADAPKLDLGSLSENVYVKSLLDTINSNVANITYKITDEKADEDETTITVEFEYVDLSGAFEQAYNDLMSNEMIKEMGVSSDNSEVVEMFVSSFDNYLKESNNTKYTKEIEFSLSKEDKKWLIDDVDTDELLDLVSGGIMSSLEGLEE